MSIPVSLMVLLLSAHTGGTGIHPGAREECRILTPEQRERALEYYRKSPLAAKGTNTSQDSGPHAEYELILATMLFIEAAKESRVDNHDAYNASVVYCSLRDLHPGTGDPEPFVHVLFRGPRLALFLTALCLLVAAGIKAYAGHPKSSRTGNA